MRMKRLYSLCCQLQSHRLSSILLTGTSNAIKLSSVLRLSEMTLQGISILLLIRLGVAGCNIVRNGRNREDVIVVSIFARDSLKNICRIFHCSCYGFDWILMFADENH
jgi:hypothetical protein